jgi:hypothetical protein
MRHRQASSPPQTGSELSNPLGFLSISQMLGGGSEGKGSTHGRGRAHQGSDLYSLRWQQPSRDPRVNTHGGGYGSARVYRARERV